VHHFWAEGLALTAVNDVVDEIEIFGDSHPFHQRALGQPLMPGISFGAERAQARTHATHPCLKYSHLARLTQSRIVVFGPLCLSLPWAHASPPHLLW
jgi:hypothetical protein